MNLPEDFPEPELQNPAADLWLRNFCERNVPPLNLGFKARVMAQIQRRSRWQRLRDTWLVLPRIAVASALSLLVIMGLLLRGGEDPSFPGFVVRETLQRDGERVYLVRFSIKAPGVEGVALAGDFSQWDPVGLSRSEHEESLYTVELTLPEGTYNYAFVVDGKRWMADLAAERVIEDGFGQKNSVIRL